MHIIVLVHIIENTSDMSAPEVEPWVLPGERDAPGGAAQGVEELVLALHPAPAQVPGTHAHRRRVHHTTTAFEIFNIPCAVAWHADMLLEY